MRSLRAFLSVARIDARPGAARIVGTYLRYIHSRDQVQRGDEGNGLAGLASYVTHRERPSPEARLFTTNRTVGDPERRTLAAYVGRSVREITGRPGRPLTAAYRFVLSPEDARGLDLRHLTRQVMSQLERDAGASPPWVAAEHRNTAHPHVHILLAARLEVGPGVFRGLRITRPRLERMKLAMGQEIRRQRGDRELGREVEAVPGRTRHADRRLQTRAQAFKSDPLRWRVRRANPGRHRGLSWYPLDRALGRLAAHYRREMERLERQEMRRRSGSGRGNHQEREWEVFE